MADTIKNSATVSITKKNKVKGAPRSKRSGANDSQSRTNYWSSGRLMEKKVRALMRCCGMTRVQATQHWLKTRRKRVRKIGQMASLG